MSFSEGLAVATFVVVYVFLVGDWFHRAWAALLGAATLVATGVIPWHRVAEAVDWNTLGLLGAMMILVGVVAETGLFDLIGAAVARWAGSSPRRLALAFAVAAAVVSMALDNVTTLLLLGPAVLRSAEAVGADPVDLMMGTALASNLGGLATLIGDPPNILIGTAAGLDFLAFLRYLGPLAAVLVVVLAGWLCLRFPAGRGAPAAHPLPRVRHPLVLAVLALTLAGFLLQGVTGWSASAVALGGAALAVAVLRPPLRRVVRAVDWGTLAFFFGVFVMVGGLETSGAVARMAQWLAATSSPASVWLAVLVGSALVSALLDNVPLVAALIPVVADLSHQHVGYGIGLWMALAAGAAIGGNATVIGASANVVAQGLVEEAGYRMDFVRFAAFGAPVAAMTAAVAAAYLYAVHFRAL
ncbi:MAG: tyrosine transporter P-protein [Firmicutes bacterium]|nr:tyrosine transporter P-protein [Alicyclobacillaceae bacterium]MCL6497689.1 tyrosine transporter P-protein [Bacillota bacterium]